MLKFQVDKIEDVEEKFRDLYEEKEGKFVLKVDGVPAQKDNDMSERIKKLEDNNRALLEEKRKAKEEAEKAALEAAKKSGDVDALEKSWNDRVEKIRADYEAKISQRDNAIKNLTVESTAKGVASELFGDKADLLLYHVRNRLDVELTDSGAKLRVLDMDGKPSASDIDALKKEFMDDKRFSPFIVGSKAGGAGSASNTTTSISTKLTSIERIKKGLEQSVK